jgi:hypothetical protein
MMLAFVLQIAALVILATVLIRWRATIVRRNGQSWKTLVARIRTDWSARDLTDQFLWREGLSATPEETWTRMQGPRGLWAMYQNAKVMQEMADYAARNCENVDRLLVATLHSDALQIRICALAALFQYACSSASEGVRVNAFRAASMYTGMSARMTQLLQESAATMVPEFVGAM